MKLLILLLFTVTSLYSAPVITWIPPYGTKAAVENLTADFGGYSPKDGISHLALQFWEPDGSGGVRYVSKVGYALEYMNDTEVGKIRDWADQYGIKTMLCLYNGVYGWDWALAVSAFNTNQSSTIDALLAKVDALDLGGVELDLEATGTASATDINAYVEFARLLGDSLEVRGKDLTCASFSYEWNAPNWDWWNRLEANVTAITSMGYESIGSANTGWAGYSSQVAKMNDESKLMLGLPDNYNSWGSPSQTLVQHLTWIKNNGNAGVGLWDMELRSSAIKTKEVWQLLSEIRGDLVTMHKTTVVTGVGGTVSPSGVVNIPENGERTFTFSPNQWFVIDEILIDGVSKGSITSYTLSNVTGEHSIEAIFKKDPNAPDLYLITASANANGIISPEGTQTIETGKSSSFSCTPDNGYAIDYVKIDGVKYGPITDGAFSNVRADHSVEAFFKEASGGDLGKYPEWYSATQTPNGDTVYWNDSLWMYQGSATAGGWGSSMEPSKWLVEPDGGNFGTPPWLCSGIYNSTADTLVTANLQYRSANDGSDTLIVTTETKISGVIKKTDIDTTIIAGVAIIQHSVSSKTARITISNNGKSISTNQSGIATVSLFDLRGRLLFKKKLSLTSGVSQTGIKTSLFSRGIYLMKVQQESQSAHARIQF